MSVPGGEPQDLSTTALFGIPAVDFDEPHEVPTDPDAIEALPARSALLIVQRGPNTGARFLLDAPRTTAGRHPRGDIFLDDVTVSRKHAEFINNDGVFAVRDVGSLNGTYVNRERIEQVELNSGDEVQIGKYRLTFHASPNKQEQ